MDPMMLFWIVLVVVFLIIEGITTALVTVWLAFGALAAALAAAFGIGLFGQIITFAAVSLLLLIATRPLARRLLSRDWFPTNSDRLIGKVAVVTQNISPPEYLGEVKADGKYWMACSEDDAPIEQGKLVKIIRIEGVKLVVLPIN